MQKFRVYLVLELGFDGGMLDQARSTAHFWLAESVSNGLLAQHYWDAHPGPDAAWVSTVQIPGTGAPEVDSVLELLDEHYGEASEWPALDEVVILGLDPTRELRDVMARWGFPGCHSLSRGSLYTR